MAENKYQYSADKKYLTKILHNDDDVCYNFEYDKYGRQTKVTVGNGTQSKALITNGYAYSSGKLIETSTYGNGYVLAQTYDRYGRLEQIKGNQVLKATYDYNSNGLLGRVKDAKAGSVTKFDYDISGRPVLITNTMPMVGSSATLHPRVEYRYGANGSKNLVQVNTMPRYGSDTNPRVADFQYEYYTSAGSGANVGQIKAVKMHSESRLVYTYDTLGRVTEKKYATTDKATTYGYLNVSGNKTTSLVSSVDNFGNKLTYTYDNLGNIKTVSENGTLQETYTYDALSRLTRVDSAVQNKTVVYTYDAGGNILSKTEYPYTTGTLGTAVKTVNYGYTDPVWKDLMTSYDGQTITYDAIGNPLQYRDGMTFTWQGRELLSVTKNGKTVNYTYDSNGQRISKTVDGETTDYYVVDGVKIGEHKAGRDIVYMHDEKGDIYGLCYDGITHYFVQNVQGDIIGILNTTGTLVAKYEYDAWGNVTAIPVAEDGCGHAVDSPDHIAHVNPFRYRGYYYDAETGFYYTHSRYYDSEVGRFISPDTLEVLDIQDDLYDKNLYIYCDDNPVIRIDSSGAVWHLAIGAAVGVATQFIADVGFGLVSGSSFGEVMSSLSPVDYVSAAIGGAIAATGIGTIGAIAANAALGGATYFADCSYKGVTANEKGFITSTVIGGVSGYVGGRGANGKKLRGIYSRSKQVINTTKSARKKAKYTAKITDVKKEVVKNTGRTFGTGIFSNLVNNVRKWLGI